MSNIVFIVSLVTLVMVVHFPLLDLKLGLPLAAASPCNHYLGYIVKYKLSDLTTSSCNIKTVGCWKVELRLNGTNTRIRVLQPELQLWLLLLDYMSQRF